MTTSTSHKLAIIQARMSSSRLPNKVLLDINGRPMLQHVIERSMRARSVDGIVVATSTDPSDDVLEQFCNQHGVPCYRGSLTDVLDRYYQAARQFHAEVIIRLTADCPLIDPTVLDQTVAAFYGGFLPAEFQAVSEDKGASPSRVNPIDFAANRMPPPWKRTIPIGLDVEVCSFSALESAWQQADQQHEREHVMPFLYEGIEFTHTEYQEGGEWFIEQGTTPLGRRVALLNHNPDLGALRWTVDTLEDLEFVRQVFALFGAYEVFGWREILAALEAHPELSTINAGVRHKTAFDIDRRNTGA
jgi:spore coat polysaccharide biosynthesis protein SpsF